MTVVNMDCRVGMGKLPANSFDAIVTDPPYGLSKQPDMREVLKHWLAGDDCAHTGSGFMGKSWDSFVPGPLTWEQAYRVLKPGGYCAVFAGSRTVDLMATSLRLAGFEVVDMLHWLYGSGFPKSMDIGKAIEAKAATDLKTAEQYAFTTWFSEACPLDKKAINEVLGGGDMARRYTAVPPSGKRPAIATREHLEALRPHLEGEVPDWIEWLVAQSTEERQNTKAHAYEAQQWDGWGTALKPCHETILLCRKPLEGTYANNLLTHGVGALNIDGCRNGERWPGNVVHDGCLPEPMDRYFYCAKASKADREAGLEAFGTASAGEVTGGREEGSAGLSSPRSGAGRTSGSKNIHPTVKPTELMRWLCRLVTPPGGIVLDPFTGSGSTGRAAALEKFSFIGFELSPVYAAIAEARIKHAICTRNDA